MLDKPELDHPIETGPTNHECPGRPRGPLSTAAQIVALTAVVLAGGCAPTIISKPSKCPPEVVCKHRWAYSPPELSEDELKKGIREDEERLAFYEKVKKRLEKSKDSKRLADINKMIKEVEKRIMSLKQKLEDKKLENQYCTTPLFFSECLYLLRIQEKTIKALKNTDPKEKKKKKALLKKLHELKAELGRWGNECKF